MMKGELNKYQLYHTRRTCKIWVFTILGCIACFSLSAQSINTVVLSAAGDIHSAEGLSLEWTLGELVIDQFAHSESSLGLGFHNLSHSEQSDTMTFFTTSVDNEDPLFSIKLFPNPASEFLQVDAELINFTSFEILSEIGTIVSRGNLRSNQQIRITQLPIGIYWLHLRRKNDPSKPILFIKS